MEVVCAHVAGALEYLHGKRLFHGHVCPENVFIRESHEGVLAKLGGLLVSRILCRFNHASFVPSPYAQNEVPLDEEEDTAVDARKADIYSFGVVATQCFTKQPPCFGRRARLVSDVESPAIRQILNNCLHTDPSSRPSAKKVVQAMVALKRGHTPVFDGADSSEDSGDVVVGGPLPRVEEQTQSPPRKKNLHLWKPARPGAKGSRRQSLALF
mmetsp:Transcript_86569/g.232109  ORF Transcript_86569/g.232109 Transcript_86569/m.232109 type:complete len:212 (+) Transcript_86569:1-636(+)